MAATRIAAGGTRQARQQAADAPVTGLSAVRDELEHHPRDPFAVAIQPALDELTAQYGEWFDIGYASGWWRATRRGILTGGVLRELDPGALAVAMRAGLEAQ